MHTKGRRKMFRKYSEYYCLGVPKPNGLRLFHYFFYGAAAPSGPRPPRCRGFTITLRHNTLGRTPLDEWPARRRDLYLTTLNKRQTSMPPTGFEPAIPTSERPQTHALDLAVSGIGLYYCIQSFIRRSLKSAVRNHLMPRWMVGDYRKPT
jgi:hypothetical protein